MKMMQIVSLLIVSLFAAAALSVPAHAASTEKIVLHIEGMTCGS